VPAGLIDQEYGVCAGRDGGGDLHQVQVHRNPLVKLLRTMPVHSTMLVITPSTVRLFMRSSLI
jgi:hypothetical protein